MLKMFERVKTRKKSSLIAEQILSLIADGKLAVGERLPGEIELAKAMGVSRPMLREALTALRIAGLVESKVGQGTYILKQFTSSYMEVLNDFLEENESPFDVLEARRVLEVGVLKLAVARQTPEDLMQIEGALSQIQTGFRSQSYEILSEGNSAFHLAIATASKNEVLEKHLTALLAAIDQSLWRTMISETYSWDKSTGCSRQPPQWWDMVALHEKIFEAIRASNMEEATKMLKKHFDVAMEILEG